MLPCTLCPTRTSAALLAPAQLWRAGGSSPTRTRPSTSSTTSRAARWSTTRSQSRRARADFKVRDADRAAAAVPAPGVSLGRAGRFPPQESRPAVARSTLTQSENQPVLPLAARYASLLSLPFSLIVWWVCLGGAGNCLRPLISHVWFDARVDGVSWAVGSAAALQPPGALQCFPPCSGLPLMPPGGPGGLLHHFSLLSFGPAP